MSREAFDIKAALEKCHKGTAWQRDLIRAQLIAAQADAYERAAEVCRALGDAPLADIEHPTPHDCADAIRALAKEAGK